MKAFIVAALLVASVAAQSMDLMDFMKHDNSMYKYKTHRSMPTIEDLLMKEKFDRHGMDWTNTPRNSVFDMEGMSSTFGRRHGVSIIPFEEIVSYPLFREYLEIPLFRQFMEQYPIVFKHYVESPLFQEFWTVPQFQMYFRNPVFFYKYIVPQVKYISKTVVPTTEGIFDYGTTSRFNPYTQYFQPRYNREWSVPRNYPTTTTSYYKYLLEKMMNHLNVNKMGQGVSEIFTDVKMLPTGQVKESTFGKIVNPITGQEKITVGDVKLVDEKIVPVQTMDFPVGVEGMTNNYQMNKIFGRNTESIKDILLKHIILNKIYGDKKVITPEVYETLFGENKEVIPEMYDMIFKHKKNVLTPEILETIFGQNKKIRTPEMFETLFDTKRTFTPEIFDTVFGENKKVLTPELYEMLVKGNKHVITPRMLETIFGKKVYTPEVYGKLFGENSQEDVYNKYNVDYEPFNYNKYNVDYEPFTYNKMNKFGESPFITRMMKNNRFSPKMDVMTLKEKMIEEIQKEKMFGHLLKNKEHSTPYSMESDFPTMTEQRKVHIPLTFGKSVVGSGIEEILREKDIKY